MIKNPINLIDCPIEHGRRFNRIENGSNHRSQIRPNLNELRSIFFSKKNHWKSCFYVVQRGNLMKINRNKLWRCHVRLNRKFFFKQMMLKCFADEKLVWRFSDQSQNDHIAHVEHVEKKCSNGWFRLLIRCLIEREKKLKDFPEWWTTFRWHWCWKRKKISSRNMTNCSNERTALLCLNTSN